MKKRGLEVVLLSFILIVFVSGIVLAQEGTDIAGESETQALEEDDSDINVDEELGGAGSKPGDLLYGVDGLFEDVFGNCLDNRKERVAEIRELVKEERFDDAKEALRGYEECAIELEREVTPEEKDEAQRSSRAIRKAIREIVEEIPEDEREEFSDVIDQENKIDAAAEIASKIKDLCEQLAKLDPSEYSRICRVKDDAPKWQIELDEDLTEEQKDSARKFAQVMSQCFRTEGRECECSELEEINKPFADRCSVIAPLAAKCQDGDENACEAMDEATEGIEDSLPDYLLEIFQELEEGVEEDQFEFHMPKECREAGAESAKECMKVMFEMHAPEECREALEKGEIDFSNEREAREACERIMFEANAPEECIEAGLADHKECGVFMFKQNAPEECIEAGLTGESRDDPRKCEKLMRELGGSEGFGGPGEGRGRGINMDCKRIENPEERLKCYDNALEGVGEFENREGGDHGGWPPPCQEAQAFTRESCEKIMNEWGEKQRNFDEGRMQRENEFRQGGGEFRRPECGPEQIPICDDKGCRCEARSGEFENREGEFRPPEGEFKPPQDGFQKPEGDSGEQHIEGFGETSGSGENSGSGEGSAHTDSGSITGSAIVDNRFVDYYYWS